MFKIYLYTEELSHFSEITENSPIMIAFILLKKQTNMCHIFTSRKKSMVQWYMPLIPFREAEAEGCNIRSAWEGKILQEGEKGERKRNET